MGKGGGAGKVYFVLYLAVVLELLIIIVERDEAEEHLLKKQKESMKIVESILSQLQSGTGTEGINTRPQDEITIVPEGMMDNVENGFSIKPDRSYIIEVGVTDIANELKKREGETDKEYNKRLKKLVKLANVESIEYQIFYNDNEKEEEAPPLPGIKDLKKMGYDIDKMQSGDFIDVGDGVVWKFMTLRRLQINNEATYNSLDLKNLSPNNIHPVYPEDLILQVGPTFTPDKKTDDSVFYYSIDKSVGTVTDKEQGEMKKRAFVVNFQPSKEKGGWYKLRFASKTNRILGVSSDAEPGHVDEESTVNIGTVQLTVRDLLKVRKELTLKLEKFNLPSPDILTKENDIDKFKAKLKESIESARSQENATEYVGKINLYGYIAQLLAPGQSASFDQNIGGIEFDIHVVKPDVPISEPVVSGIPQYMATFDKVNHVFDFTVSPWQGAGNNGVEGKVLDANTGATVARLNCEPVYQLASSTGSEPARGKDADFRASVDQELPPGRYKIEIIHKLGGRQSDLDGNVTLEVFKTTLTEDSEKELLNLLPYRTIYGQNIIVNTTPTSGGKIKSNQFRISLTTDIDQQRPPFEGLSIPAADGLYLLSDMKEMYLSVSWVQPLTGKEIDLLPTQTFQINQKKPKINPSNSQQSVSGTEKDVKIRIRNIKVVPSKTGDPEKTGQARTKVRLGKVDVKIQGYDVKGEPTVEKDGDNYSIYLEITGKLPRGEEKIKGTVSVEMFATAINPLNNVVSKEEKKKISVRVSYEPERKKRKGGTGGSRRR
jgi:hypothetical protein